MARNTRSGRQARLEVDYTDLMNLASRSDFITVEPQDVQAGWAPEKYLITFTCKGVAGIDEQGAPIVSEHHQVSLYMTRDYPGKEPALLWLTPIWHPNIDRAEPRHVCTNAVQTYHAQKPIDELVLSLAEMVQYRRYHARWEPPFPQDPVVAQWVRDVAEPRGWIGAGTPFDARVLLREYRIVRGSAPAVVPALEPAEIASLETAALEAPAPETIPPETQPSASKGPSDTATRLAGQIAFGAVKKPAGKIAFGAPRSPR